ncbi:aminoglycoside phosphotransferase family protein [Burkholderia sp. Bp9140]|uniref:phosphotransferase n=1 Tax=Burkholderia sp. Bp9140 TaxID=2184572 RepID=UPI000F573C55|nr:phosphotransferase [Burkholderia sp. Bp9140]RQR51337.1 aminoglycoside phosphotransferase family protein [Burkholderia sp. Bp9140]
MESRIESGERETLLASLLRMGLIGTDEDPSLVRLTGGVSSLIVRAETRAGTVCVKQALAKLRVATEWFAPVERNSAEVAWMKIVSDLVPGAVPRIIAVDTQSQTFAMEYFTPHCHRVWKDELREGRASASVARSIGWLLADIHRGTAGNSEVQRAFATDASFFALRLEPYFLATAAANADCAAPLRALSADTAATKRALVHGDLSPKNILTGPHGPVLLDAECAWYGDPAFDIAFCLTHLLLKCVWRPAGENEFLACFDAMSNAYLSRVTWESMEELEARAARLLPALLLARVDGKSPVEYLRTTDERDRVRRFAKTFVVSSPKTLKTIRYSWSRQRV